MKLTRYLQQPMDNSPLIMFRILFGLLMFFESFGAVVTGWVKETFVDVNFTFNFIGFDFLQIIVGPQAYLLYYLMGVLGIFIAIGFRYRISMISFAILWSITYFAQKSHYNNHYYLLMLISFLMCFLPANRYASEDVKLGYVAQQLTCPRWAVAVLMLQIAIVYFYAAIAKLYPDWLVGRPLEIWFHAKRFTSPFWSDEFAQQLRQLFSHHSMHLFFAYSGILFDLLVVPLFLWNKWTRWFALVASLIFHLTNSAIFHVGVFPYFALAFVIFFFQPEFVRKYFFPPTQLPSIEEMHTPYMLPKWFYPFFGAYFLIQILLPLRHHVIPGNVLWDESGHRLSWRMMLRTKSAMTSIYVLNKDTNQKQRVNVYDYVSRNQWNDLRTKPDMMWQFAQRLKKEYEMQNIPVSVFIDSKIKINGRPAVQFTDSTIDIADQPWNFFGRQSWVLEDDILPLQGGE